MEGELLLGAKGTKRASASTSKPTADKKKKYASPSGNRTPVSCVTGRDTYHYTNEDWLVEKPPKLQNTTYRQRYREKKVAEPTPRGRGHTLATKRGKAREGEEEKKSLLLRAGFEPATYGCLSHVANYSPPLYQLSYRR